MKKLNINQGGLFLKQDDLDTLQTEILTPLEEMFSEIDYNFIISGCDAVEASGTITISPGLVYLNKQIIRFKGVSNLPFAQFGSISLIAGEQELTEQRVYRNGTEQDVFKELVAIATSAAPGEQPFIVIAFFGAIVNPKISIKQAIARNTDMNYLGLNINIGTVADRIRRSNEDWHIVGEAGEVPYSANFGDTYLRFRKDLFGRVYITGLIISNGQGGIPIFTLPEGYRPSDVYVGPGDDTNSLLFICYSNPAVNGIPVAYLNISIDGVVRIYPLVGETSSINIAEISFTSATFLD